MIGFLTIGSAATTRQPISNMINYATNTKIDTIYYNLFKSDAQNIYQWIGNMTGYLTTGNA